MELGSSLVGSRLEFGLSQVGTWAMQHEVGRVHWGNLLAFFYGYLVAERLERTGIGLPNLFPPITNLGFGGTACSGLGLILSIVSSQI